MQIELSDESRQFVEKLLADGRFQSAEDAVDYALKLFEIQADAHSLNEKLQKGLDDVAAGRVSPLDAEDVKRRGRERRAANQKAGIDG